MKKKWRLGDRFCAAAMCVLVPLLAGGCTELRNDIIGAVETAARSALEGAVQQFFDQFGSVGG